MATNLPSYDHRVEDDFIDMDKSSTTFLCYSKSSPPHSREFEFQTSFNPPERETTTSPADELFYKGNLLPLHIPLRLQMVQKLLQSSTNSSGKDTDAPEDTTTTECCKISPSNSCHVNGELSQEEYIYECSAELTQSEPKKSWSKKIKLIRQSSISLKLKASKAYLQSLFTTKSGCSDESNADLKAKDCSNGYLKAEKKNPFVQLQKERWLVADTNGVTLMRSIERERLLEEECIQRKSFSGAINCHLTPRSSLAISSCSSSSSSFSSVNSIGFYGSQMLNRSSSVNSEMESSIQGAIAYCKKSQVSARKSVSDVEASRIVADCKNQEKAGLCRG